jgi:hypothetical protein
MKLTTTTQVSVDERVERLESGISFGHVPEGGCPAWS